MHSDLIPYLCEFATEERKAKILSVLSSRSRSLVAVLDGISDFGNRDAVYRSAEAMGVLEVHWIEPRYAGQSPFRTSNRSAQGSEKWLDIQAWQQPSNCLKLLKDRGYQIYSTNLTPTAVSIHDLKLTPKTALVFGNEHSGVSKEVLAASDGQFKIPMSGFTQSFNISVAAALCLEIVQTRMKSQNLWEILLDEDREKLHLEYLKNSVTHSQALIKRFLSSK